MAALLHADDLTLVSSHLRVSNRNWKLGKEHWSKKGLLEKTKMTISIPKARKVQKEGKFPGEGN